MTAVSGHEIIKTRKVFYIPGFDPMPPRRYRELYRREGQKQSQISGYSLQQTKGTQSGTSSWNIRSEFDGCAVETEFECLIWADIVKASMHPSFLNIYIRSLAAYTNYLTSGALRRILKVRLGPAIVALYPPVVTLLQLILGVVLALGIALVIWPLSAIAALPVALTAAIGWFLWMRHLDRKLYAHYLMLDYTFFARGQGQLPEELRQRIDVFSDKVSEALAADYDEVLLVGHSSGAQLAVNVTAELLRRGLLPPKKLGLLTLGHSIPMVSFMPNAQYMRRDLKDVSQAIDISWLDVSAPGDGACFALADPVAISGVSTPFQRHPKVVSAAFSRTLSDNQQDALRLKFFKKHFQYLCAFERPETYDYFAITAGPYPFERWVDSFNESPSKISQVFSGYTDV